jgi:hypothetical protein
VPRRLSKLVAFLPAREGGWDRSAAHGDRLFTTGIDSRTALRVFLPKKETAMTVDDHFVGKDELRAVYDRLVGMVEKFGPVEQDPKKTSIHLNRRTAFAGVALRKDCIVLTIKADGPITSPRIFKSEQTSAKRFHHEVKLAKAKDVDAEVRGWLKAAYDLSE